MARLRRPRRLRATPRRARPRRAEPPWCSRRQDVVAARRGAFGAACLCPGATASWRALVVVRLRRTGVRHDAVVPYASLLALVFRRVWHLHLSLLPSAL